GDLANECSQQPLLGTLIGAFLVPHRLQIARKRLELIERTCTARSSPRLLRDPSLQCLLLLERDVPSALEFSSNKPVFGIARLVLSLRTKRAVRCGLQVPAQRREDIRVCLRLLLAGQDRGLYGRRFDDAQEFPCHGSVHRRTTEGDATGFFRVKLHARTGISNELVLIALV